MCHHFNLKFNISQNNNYYGISVGLRIFAIKVRYIDDTYLVESMLVSIPVTIVLFMATYLYVAIFVSSIYISKLAMYVQL